MAQVIIGIHGLGNKPSPKTLAKWWKESLHEGQELMGQMELLPMFKLVYWADLMYEKPLDENVKNPNDPQFLKERYMPKSDLSAMKDRSFRQKVIDFFKTELDAIFLNDDWTTKYNFITDTIIQKYFRELDIYYHKECHSGSKNPECSVKDKIQKRLADCLREHQHDDIFLIAHSMGSIIAYDVLTACVPDIKINTFVTIGSPLGLPIVKSKIATSNGLSSIEARLRAPNNIVNHWYNFSDLEDKVALNYDLGDDYAENEHGIKPIDFVVYNDYQMNGEPNPHKSYGYLRTPEFTACLTSFLAERKKMPIDRLREMIRSFQRKIKKIPQLVSLQSKTA